MPDIDSLVHEIVNYGIGEGLTSPEDRTYVTNRILNLLNKDSVSAQTGEGYRPLKLILEGFLEYAEKQGLCGDGGIASKDIFDTSLMDCLLPPPSAIRRRFRALYAESPEKATDWYYRLSQDSNYIRTDRIAKDIKWQTATEYGDLDITINLSKPEKDPRAIAAALKAQDVAYPKCQLCLENEGYRGRLDHPARANHRVIPIELLGQRFYFQYSPYVYYNEHCIVFNAEHIPMKIDRETFGRLFDFIKLFPHYAIGSNADLPIVGGSILSHDHFQGGNYEFPMARARDIRVFSVPGYEGAECSVIHWPLSVIRIRGKDTEELLDLAAHILEKWRAYTDEEAFIYAETDGEPHNTITPIVRRRGECFEMDLTLRNNIRTEECPLGFYHPHNELHHIKKENIGLVEVMGLAILPARLKEEMAVLKEKILAHEPLREDDRTAAHADWAEGFLKKYPQIDEDNLDGILRDEIGHVFKRVLEDAGVFKQTEEGQAALKRFTDML
ncbi:MAG: UDP-glucose--hexose-1-phosphate uridylyltransferase [Lachnospiraceae bacterium]|nr:UDP-glucose--hexose-1-phosphate uridylyltransferase [Lachnospiraceae bacterium]